MVLEKLRCFSEQVIGYNQEHMMRTKLLELKIDKIAELLFSNSRVN